MSARVLLATIRDNGLCPCPRCLMPKTKLDRMGQHWDFEFRMREVRQYLLGKVQQARNIIYKLGQAVSGTGVDGVLKSTSSVPTVVSALLHDDQLTVSLTGHGTECILRANRRKF